MESVNSRISKVINYYCKTKKEFYQEFGRTKQWASNITKEGFPIGANTIKEIISKFPDVNAYWLLTGDGSMIKADKTKKLIPQNESLVFNQNGEVLTNTLLVAEKFGKRHANVIKSVEEHISDLNSTNLKVSWFCESKYCDGKGEMRKMYLMTRDGFSLLVMSFNNTRDVLKFKLEYIEAFNKMERELNKINSTPQFNIPTTLSGALRLAAEQADRIESQQREIEKKSNSISQLQPKADFLDKTVLTSDSKVDIGQAAKILKLSYGRNTLFQKLRNSGIFFKYKNEPKQEYVDRGYFEVFEVPYEQNGKKLLSLKVFVTQSGLCWLNKTLNGNMFNQQIAQFN